MIMNLDPCKYMMKLQRKDGWKWRDNINTTREMSGFLVGEVSDESRVSLMGDRLANFFWGKMLNCWFIVYSNAIMKSK